MNSVYLELLLNGYIIGPISAFRRYVFNSVIPAFGNLEKRAGDVAEEHFSEIGSQPVHDDIVFDMADVAEAAQQKSLDWFLMMVSLRQTMLNLLAVGLFHLTEQQLARLCRDGRFTVPPPTDTKLEEVKKWYGKHVALDLETLPSWGAINELRLIANAVKHAEGSATKQLRLLRPELFSNPAYEEIYREEGLTRTMDPVHAPLSGEEFFVTEQLLDGYSAAAESFFREIADCFKSHSDDFVQAKA
jgi:hypothetical protein